MKSFKIRNSQFPSFFALRILLQARPKSNKGFTLVEIVVAMGIIAILFGFISINLGHVTRATSVNQSVLTLVADMKSQQEKAMSGGGNGTSGSSFGIYFEPTKYTLFRGSSYSASDPSNIVVELDTPNTFANITFPSSTLVFAQRSGEVVGYSSSTNTIRITNSAGNEFKTIRLNRYGVVDHVN